jgi:hypothetical protein
MLASVVAKSLFVAGFAAFLALRTGRLSPWQLLFAAGVMQVVGLALDLARGGSLLSGLDALRLGIPGVLIMGFGGYAVLRFLARGDTAAANRAPSTD